MSLTVFSDEHFMNEAFKEAKIAFEKDEVPVGAVVVFDKKNISRAHNLTETLNDVTAHAEMQAFTSAANTLGSKYLNECSLYVTLEPCTMCAGASFWTQIGNIIYGASDKKRGFQLQGGSIVHPKTTIKKGVLELECSNLLKDFFEKKR